MTMLQRLLCGLIVVLLAGSVAADSDFFKKFKDDYATLDQDLMNNEGETGPVTNFVYQKDVATFTFTKGDFFLLRYVDGRPTTAIFIGQGNVKIDIPSHVERQMLRYASGDSTVNEDFTVCFLRLGDNFDQRLREVATLRRKTLGWPDFNVAKKAQGEVFFRPVIEHTFDNYFQLLRSCYERADDGFFFVDFNRYTYMFDPNRPEQVTVGYEHEGGDRVITEAAVFQRKERARYDDLQMSDIAYPTTILSREATLNLGGIEGNTIDSARADISLLLNSDSAKFVTMYLPYNLALDSVAVNGQRVDVHRRRDFNVFGLLLPQYAKKGDTLAVTLWYAGKNYMTPVPWVENPAASPHKITFIAPEGFNYIMPGMGTPEKIGRGKQKFVAEPLQPFDLFTFRSYAASFSTVPGATKDGLPLTFLKSPAIDKRHYDCFVPEEIYEPAVKGAVDFLAQWIGNPPGTFDLTVFPSGGNTMPGLIEVPQVQCLSQGTGGIELTAGYQAARQWFGASMRPASGRELWLADALPWYLGLMYLQAAVPGQVFYNELRFRRDMLETVVDNGDDHPLATGERTPDSLRAMKGAWVIHMLRQLMVNLDKGSEESFRGFLQEAASITNTRTFTNADIIKAAEKYYGQPLDWFFNQWLYGINLPEYSVQYGIEPKDNQWMVNVLVDVDKVDANYTMPVTMRVICDGAPDVFARQIITGKQASFQLGPFSAKPKELVFNEFVSVLSKDKTGKLKS